MTPVRRGRVQKQNPEPPSVSQAAQITLPNALLCHLKLNEKDRRKRRESGRRRERERKRVRKRMRN